MSQTPRQDYLQVTRNFIIAMQSHIREFEDHPDILSKGLLADAYKAQAALVQQHFTYLSIMYDKEFMPPIEEDTNKSGIILA